MTYICVYIYIYMSCQFTLKTVLLSRSKVVSGYMEHTFRNPGVSVIIFF